MSDPLAPTAPQVNVDYSSTVRCTPEPPLERLTTNELIFALAFVAFCIYSIRALTRRSQ